MLLSDFVEDLQGLETKIRVFVIVTHSTSRILSRILNLGRGELYKALPGGIWGHAPQEKFGILGLPKLILMQFER